MGNAKSQNRNTLRAAAGPASHQRKRPNSDAVSSAVPSTAGESSHQNLYTAPHQNLSASYGSQVLAGSSAQASEQSGVTDTSKVLVTMATEEPATAPKGHYPSMSAELFSDMATAPTADGFEAKIQAGLGKETIQASETSTSTTHRFPEQHPVTSLTNNAVKHYEMIHGNSSGKQQGITEVAITHSSGHVDYNVGQRYPTSSLSAHPNVTDRAGMNRSEDEEEDSGTDDDSDEDEDEGDDSGDDEDDNDDSDGNIENHESAHMQLGLSKPLAKQQDDYQPGKLNIAELRQRLQFLEAENRRLNVQVTKLKAKHTQDMEALAPTTTLSVWSERHSTQAKMVVKRRTNLPQQGHVVTVRTDKNDRMYGFIRPHSLDSAHKEMDASASHVDEQANVVFFHSSHVISAGLDLLPGDDVEFTLERNSRGGQQRLAANHVRLTCPRPRFVEVYNLWMENVERLMEERNGVLKALECHAAWQGVFQASNFTSNMHAKLMQLCISLKGRSGAHLESFRHLVDSIMPTKFFSTKNGGLRTYIQAQFDDNDGCNNFDDQTDKDDDTGEGLQLAADFLLCMAKVNAGFSRTALPFLELLTERQTPGKMDRCLLDFIKAIAAAGSGDVRCLDWNELPLVPTTSELRASVGEDEEDAGHRSSTVTQDSDVLHAVRQSGAYESAQQYLDTYFRLLREDCFSALKQGIKSLLSGKLDLRDMHVYSNVRLVALQTPQSISSVVSGSGIHLALKVKPCRDVRNWANAPNLMFGNLLCISTTGDFSQPIWATVANRDLKLLEKNNIIFVEPCTEYGSSNLADVFSRLQQASPASTIMVESPTYYRAYQPILRALQNTNPHKLAFFEEIVKASSDEAHSPEYLADPSDVQLNSACLYKDRRHQHNTSLDDLLQTLSSSKTDLCVDKAQQEAIAHALTNRVSLIQGPPGTGKTYVGVKLVQLLLSADTCPDKPILVLTYKNHALDEFLLECDRLFPEKIVRVGGRSGEPRLERHNLGELCRHHKRAGNRDLNRIYYSVNDRLNEMRPHVAESAKCLAQDSQFSAACFINQAGPGQIRHLLLGIRCGAPQPVLNCRDILLGGHASCLEPERLQEMVDHGTMEMLNWTVAFALQYWVPTSGVFEDLRQQVAVAAAVNLPADKQGSSSAMNDADEMHDADDVANLLHERMASFGYQGQNEDGSTMTSLAQEGESNLPVLLPGVEHFADVLATSLLNEADVWHMPPMQRAQLVQVMLHRQVRTSRARLLEKLQDFSSVCRHFTEVDSQLKVAVMRDRHIVGMTVTGAAIHQQLLTALEPAIVLVEEAAEVLEPQLLAILGPWVQHLILIGDHQQLRPPVESYNLVRNYHFDVSMMERLLNNHMPHAKLLTQNRMRPEFSQLLKDIYPDLGDNLAVVSHNEPPACMDKSMFFWDHEDPEIGGRSYVNKGEVERVIKLSLYLVQQGYMPWKITVLSAYQGQTIVLRRELRQRLREVFRLEDHPDLRLPDEQPGQTSKGNAANRSNVWHPPREVLVHTVDRYQGDENDIVIVSLTRSNAEKKIGFLKTLNRRCVAQSRARCGLIFIGNKQCLGSCSHWRRLIDSMADVGCVGRTITLCCPRHPDQSRMFATTSAHIKLGKSGFCDKPCGETMECNAHICKKNCQPAHPHKVCREVVHFKFADCKHPGQRLCHEDERSIKCLSLVGFSCLNGCGKAYERQCFNKAKEHDITAKCTEQTQAELPCGHSVFKPCNQLMTTTKCEYPCLNKRPRCGHQCSGKCGHDSSCDDIICKACEEERKKRHAQYKSSIEDQIRQKEQDRDRTNVEAEASAPAGGELISLSDGSSEFMKIRDKSLMLLKDRLPEERQPHVTGVQEVKNLTLLLRHLAAKQRLCGWEDHSTPEILAVDMGVGKKLDHIVEKGLELRECEPYGDGIEFKHRLEFKEVSHSRPNYLLWCEVLLGLTEEWKKQRKVNAEVLRSRRSDSLSVQLDGSMESSIVYDPGQVLPKFVVQFSCQRVVAVLKNAIEKEALRVNTMKVIRLTPQREVEADSAEDHVFRQAESQFLRQKAPMEGKKLSVTSVNYFVNPALVQVFAAKHDEIKAKYKGGKKKKLRQAIWAFHSTNTKNVASIMENNFKLDMVGESTHCAGKFGAGIYFSEFPDYALKYGGKEKALLLCYVLPGKSFQCKKLMVGGDLQEGYDSHQYAADEHGYGKEICVFDTAQILPCFEINYDIDIQSRAAPAVPVSASQQLPDATASSGQTRPSPPHYSQGQGGFQPQFRGGFGRHRGRNRGRGRGRGRGQGAGRGH